MKRRRKSRAKSEESDQSPPSLADFSFSLTRVAVSQICGSVGYKAADSSVLDSLTLITTKFLQSLACLAASFSNAANRTEVNLFDIVNGLQDIALSTTDSFPGGSTLHDTDSHCLIKSAVLRNLSDFVTYAAETPFAKPLPRREINGSSRGELTRTPQAPPTRSPEVNPLPAWLPPFPDASLYLQHYIKDSSNHLWENSDCVIGRVNSPESLKTESCRGGRSGGCLPQKRAKVRFKVERDLTNNGCSYTSHKTLERWLDNNDGESAREFKVKKEVESSARFSKIQNQ